MCRNVLHVRCLGEQLVVSELQRAPGCYSSVTHTCWTTIWVPGKERIFLSAAPSRPALGLIHHPTQCQPGVLSSWVKQLDNAVNHSASLVPLLTYTPIYLHGTVHRHNFIYLTTYYYILNTSSLEHARYNVPCCDVKA
jgi:hypothetical protein